MALNNRELAKELGYFLYATYPGNGVEYCNDHGIFLYITNDGRAQLSFGIKLMHTDLGYFRWPHSAFARFEAEITRAKLALEVEFKT